MRFRAIWNFFSTVVTMAVLGIALMGALSSTTPIDVDMIMRACGTEDENCVKSDAFWIAVQIGRLDIISICLAILGVTVALSAVFGFLYVKEKSELVAREVTKQIATDMTDKLKADIAHTLEQHAKTYLEEQVPKIATDYFGLAMNSVGGQSYADQIADKADDEVERGMQ